MKEKVKLFAVVCFQWNSQQNVWGVHSVFKSRVNAELKRRELLDFGGFQFVKIYETSLEN